MKQTLALALALFCVPFVAQAQDADRAPFEFKITQTTRPGESVYVVGDHPELGAWDARNALRMVPFSYPNWSLSVSLPKGTAIRYTFLIRANAPEYVGDAKNATYLTNAQNGRVAGSLSSRLVRIRYFSGFGQAILRYEQSPGQFADAAMSNTGPGRSGAERLWDVSITTTARIMAFVVHDGRGRFDNAPGKSNYKTPMASVVLQDGRLHDSVPAAGETRGKVTVVSNWYSNTLKNGRDIFIYLPRNYAQSGKRYPVLYMHDGQNLFGPDAMFGGWRAEDAADSLINAGRMAEIIIVGVGNTMDRMAEYVPPEDGGGADDYGRFLTQELKPWVDRTLRTRTGPEDTGILGSSLGGIASLYLGWRRPDVFGKVGSFSGSYFFDKFTGTMRGDGLKQPLKIWLDSGTAGASADGFKDTMSVRDLLLGKGYTLHGALEHFTDIGAVHNEAYWRERLGQAFEFLFPAR